MSCIDKEKLIWELYILIVLGWYYCWWLNKWNKLLEPVKVTCESYELFFVFLLKACGLSTIVSVRDLPSSSLCRPHRWTFCHVSCSPWQPPSGSVSTSALAMPTPWSDTPWPRSSASPSSSSASDGTSPSGPHTVHPPHPLIWPCTTFISSTLSRCCDLMSSMFWVKICDCSLPLSTSRLSLVYLPGEFPVVQWAGSSTTGW